MVHSVEAIIKADGQVVLNKKIKLKHTYRAIVTILDEAEVSDVTLMSEDALAEDWTRPEEDAAWAHLQ
jgi:hypothetical protein